MMSTSYKHACAVLLGASSLHACAANGSSADTAGTMSTGEAPSTTAAVATAAGTTAGTGGTSEVGTTASRDTATSGDSNPRACGEPWDVIEQKPNGQTHAAFAIAVADDGTIAIAGQLEDIDNPPNRDAWIGLYDAQGEQLWNAIVDGGFGRDTASDIAFAGDGDVVVTGSFAGEQHRAVWTQKHNRDDGSVLWTLTEASAFDGDNQPGGLAPAPDGSIIEAATVRVGDQDSDVRVRKLDPDSGAELWSQTFSGAADGNGFSIDLAGPVAVAPDGSIYVAGRESVDFETKEAVVLKFDGEGVQQWKLAPQANGTAHSHEITAIAAGPDNEVYFAIAEGGVYWHLWLYRASPASDIAWELTEETFVFYPTDDWIINGIAVAADGRLTIGGRLTNAEPGQGISWSEAWVVRMSRAGEPDCFGSHTWDNERIIPAQTFAYALDEGPGGTVMAGEIVDGPENRLWIGGFR